MENKSKWIFTKEQIENSPSRKYNISADRELKYRQECASFIQELGQSLKVRQLVINTAIVFMQRFFMVHSLTKFDRYKIGLAAIFLSAKTEDSPLRTSHVIYQSHKLLYKNESPLTPLSQKYLKLTDELILNESALIMTLGFDFLIQHPHSTVLRWCEVLKANMELTKTSYLMASNSLHLTTMCLQYTHTVVACFCIHLASKWTSYNIPLSKLGEPWFKYVDPTVTYELLNQLTDEFLEVFDKCPTKIKRVSQSILEKQKLKRQNTTSNSMSINKPQIPDQESKDHQSKSQKNIAEIPQQPSRPIGRNVVHQERTIATLPSRPKSIFSPEITDEPSKFQDWNRSLQRTQVSEKLAANLQPAASSSNLQSNLLKRRISDNQISIQKRQCISDQSAKIMNEKSIILKSKHQPEILMPIVNNPSENASMVNLTFPLVEKLFNSEFGNIHQVPQCPPLNIFDNSAVTEVAQVKELPNLKKDHLISHDISSVSPIISDSKIEALTNSIPKNFMENTKSSNLEYDKFHQVPSSLPINIFENQIKIENTSEKILSKKEEVLNFKDVLKSKIEIPLNPVETNSSQLNMFSKIETFNSDLRNIEQIPPCPPLNIFEDELKFENAQVENIPEIKEDVWNSQSLSNNLQGSYKVEIPINSISSFMFSKIENSVNEVPVTSTVDFSQLHLDTVDQIKYDPIEEKKSKHKSKKSKKHKKEKKKDKREKKDKEKRKEKRKHEIKEREQFCDKMNNNVQKMEKIMPIKISIPKEKLNLSSSFFFALECKKKLSQESDDCDAYVNVESDSSPAESYQTCHNYNVQPGRITVSL